MKNVLFKKRSDVKRGRKALSLTQKNEDQECITHVRKSFIYHVVFSEQISPNANQPQVYIKKAFDTQKRVEKFTFQVRGSFFMTHNLVLLEVRFQHTLNIRIVWKSKIFSPKKSAVLT